jgi:hypothetical protein
MEFREDAFVYPLMIDLAACLCTEIQQSGLPEPCQCGVMPGGDAILDYCGECDGDGCGGQAWVRLSGAFPSTRFPAVQDAAASCVTPLAFVIEVGIARCAPVGTVSTVQGFAPPTLEQQIEAVRLQTADMSAMKRAVSCCLENKYSDLTYTLGVYTPISGGDCNAGTWLISVWSA